MSEKFYVYSGNLAIMYLFLDGELRQKLIKFDSDDLEFALCHGKCYNIYSDVLYGVNYFWKEMKLL